jgi:uncharacterized membrane protein
VNWTVSSSRRLTVGALLGIVAGVVVGLLLGWAYAASAGFDIAALVFLVWTWAVVGRMDAEQTALHATMEDPTLGTINRSILLTACVASLGAVGFVLVQAANEHGAKRAWVAALGFGSIVLSWFAVHGLFTLRYARLYYRSGGDPRQPGAGKTGGIDFGLDSPPRYGDFAYLALMIGMAYQLPDTPLTTGIMRAAVLRHALLSYLFGALILGASVNLIVSLAS